MPDVKEGYNPLNDKKFFDAVNNAFIKKFSYDDKYYIYDVHTNYILNVDEIAWKLFSDKDDKYIVNINILLNSYPESKVVYAINEVKEAIEKKGLFQNHIPSIGLKKNISELDEFYNGNCESLTLNVTENCNMRCKYCVYSGNYNFRRIHSNKDMNWDVAKTAIDEFILNSRNITKPIVSFYGGEPLLNYALIRKVVNYLTKKDNREITYTITTNGLLLDKEIISFLYQNRFSTIISLDGPKEIHDRYRVHINGEGTWNKIVRNINIIKSLFPDAFSKYYFKINAVIAPPWPIKETLQYFEENFLGSFIELQYVDMSNTEYFKNLMPVAEMNNIFKNNYLELESYFLKCLIDNKILPRHLFTFFNKIYIPFIKKYSKIDDDILGGGICWLGKYRTFVTCDGEYYPCEKVSELYNVGNIKTGLDIKKVFSLINKIQEFLKDICSGCWALTLCKRCLLGSSFYDTENIDKLKLFCEKEKDSNLHLIKRYIWAIERNPTVFIK